MLDTPVPLRENRLGDGRSARELVGRDPETERIREFVPVARTGGAPLLVTDEPGVGKTGLLDAATVVASAAGTRILHAAGIQLEAGISFSGPRLPEPQSHQANGDGRDGNHEGPNRFARGPRGTRSTGRDCLYRGDQRARAPAN